MDINEDSIDFSRKSFARSRKPKKFSPKKNSPTKRKVEDESVVEPKRRCSQFEDIEINNLSLNSKSSPAKLTRARCKKTVSNKIPTTTSPLKAPEVKHEESNEVYQLKSNNSPTKKLIISKEIEKNSSNKRKEDGNRNLNRALVFKSSSIIEKEAQNEVVDKNFNSLISTSTVEPQTTKEITNSLNKKNVSPSKSLLLVNLFKKRKKKKFVKKTFNSFKMSSTEIGTYFSQLEKLALHNQAERTNPIKVKPFVWTQIRDPVKLSVNHSGYTSRGKISKRKIFSKQEKAKLTNCFVLLENLTQRSVDLICKEHKVKVNSNLFSNKKFVVRKVNSNSNGNSKIVQKRLGSTSCAAHPQIVCKEVDGGVLNGSELKLPKSNKKKCKSKPRYKARSSKNNTSKTVFNSIENKQVINKKYATSEEKYSSETNNGSVEGRNSQLANVFVSLKKLSALPSDTKLEADTKLEIRIKDDTNIPYQVEDNILLPDVLMSNNENAKKIVGCSRSESPKNKMATKNIANRPRMRKNYSNDKNLKKTKIKFDEVKSSSKYSSQTPLVMAKAYSESSVPIVLLKDNIKTSNFLSVHEKTTDSIERVKKTTETSCRRDERKLKVKNNELSKLKKQKNNKISSSAKVKLSTSKEAQIKVNDNHSVLTGFSNVLSCNRREYGNSSSVVLNGVDSSDSLKTMWEKDLMKIKTSNKHNKAVVRKHKQSTSQLKLSLKTKNEATDINIDVPIAAIKETKCSEFTQKENFNVSNSSFTDSKYQNSLIKHPIVCIDRLTKFLFPNTSDKELNVKEIKRSMSVDNMMSSFKQKRGSLVCPKRRRSLRLHSLDGAFDNSSSDDNVGDTDRKSEKPISTPKKRPSSSKNSQTPKASYVPLDIKITKSPTVQVERIPVLEKQSSSLKKIEPHSGSNIDSESSCMEKTIIYDSFAKFGSSEASEPCNKITELEPKINLIKVDLPSCSSYTCENSINVDSSRSCSFDARKDIKILTKAHPIVKKLKVNVKRLSCDTQGL